MSTPVPDGTPATAAVPPAAAPPADVVHRVLHDIGIAVADMHYAFSAAHAAYVASVAELHATHMAAIARLVEHLAGGTGSAGHGGTA